MSSFTLSRKVVYGVDFSGAQDAGKNIWISRGIIDENMLHIVACFKSEDLPASGRLRGHAFRALREFVERQKDSIVGMDFPFGIPRTLVRTERWEKFVLSFHRHYVSPDDFRTACRKTSGGNELKRYTDLEARTPLSPYNLRIYRQTYFGIREVLAPLIRREKICVLPMQKPLSGMRWVLEVCPASTLKKAHLNVSYKGKAERQKTARKTILEGIEKTGLLAIKKTALRSIIFEDRGGDALDSVIAAFAAFRALRNALSFEVHAPHSLEGWVYV